MAATSPACTHVPDRCGTLGPKTHYFETGRHFQCSKTGVMPFLFRRPLTSDREISHNNALPQSNLEITRAWAKFLHGSVLIQGRIQCIHRIWQQHDLQVVICSSVDPTHLLITTQYAHQLAVLTSLTTPLTLQSHVRSLQIHIFATFYRLYNLLTRTKNGHV